MEEGGWPGLGDEIGFMICHSIRTLQEVPTKAEWKMTGNDCGIEEGGIFN